MQATAGSDNAPTGAAPEQRSAGRLVTRWASSARPPRYRSQSYRLVLTSAHGCPSPLCCQWPEPSASTRLHPRTRWEDEEQAVLGAQLAYRSLLKPPTPRIESPRNPQQAPSPCAELPGARLQVPRRCNLQRMDPCARNAGSPFPSGVLWADGEVSGAGTGVHGLGRPQPSTGVGVRLTARRGRLQGKHDKHARGTKLSRQAQLLG